MMLTTMARMANSQPGREVGYTGSLRTMSEAPSSDMPMSYYFKPSRKRVLNLLFGRHPSHEPAAIFSL